VRLEQWARQQYRVPWPTFDQIRTIQWCRLPSLDLGHWSTQQGLRTQDSEGPELEKCSCDLENVFRRQWVHRSYLQWPQAVDRQLILQDEEDFPSSQMQLQTHRYIDTYVSLWLAIQLDTWGTCQPSELIGLGVPQRVLSILIAGINLDMLHLFTTQPIAIPKPSPHS